MRLIWIHGPPASGKLSVARSLSALVDAGVLHNHLSIDLARPILDFGDPGFWSLVDELRLTCIRTAAESKRPMLLYTSCYDDPYDRPVLERYEGVLKQTGSSLVPVFLHCEVAELERRVGNDDRKQAGKITTASALRKTLSEWNCIPIPRDNCITIDTTTGSPEAAAEAIAAML